MHFATFKFILAALPFAAAFQGYLEPNCRGEPTGLSSCDGRCYSFEGFRSFRADVGIRPTRHCVQVYSEADCRGERTDFDDQVFNCTNTPEGTLSYRCNPTNTCD